MKSALLIATLLFTAGASALTPNQQQCVAQILELDLYKAFPQDLKVLPVKGTENFSTKISYLYAWSNLCEATYQCTKEAGQYKVVLVDTTCQ